MWSEMRPPLINDQLLACRDVAALQTEMQRFSEAMSFDYFSVVGVVDKPNGTSFHSLALKLPETYSHIYEDPGFGKNDPVMQRLRNASAPIWWDEDFYTSHDQRKRWATMADCGLRSGAALALHLPAGKHLLLGLEQRRESPSDVYERQRALATLTLFATYIAEPALFVMGVSDQPSDELTLTPQEVECLKWRGEGKSAWETGKILGLSESRINKVSALAARKLGCMTTSQATLKALRLGLLF